MKATQPELGPRPRHPFYVAPGDWARRSLVDEAFVARSVAAMRDMPDAEQRLREAMADTLRSIGDIDRVYGTEPNEWATATRERLWLEHFTAEEILRGLSRVGMKSLKAIAAMPLNRVIKRGPVKFRLRPWFPRRIVPPP